MQIIEASRDVGALERFLPLFIEQAASQMETGLKARRRALRRAAAVNPQRFDRQPASRAIPHAFELWIAHLGWLDRISGGVGFTLDDLTTEEARGLALLRQARERFWQDHSSCPRCRSVNVRGASFCGTCGLEFGISGQPGK